jgi:hypothetical protein
MADPSLLLASRTLLRDPPRNLIVSRAFATAVAEGQLEQIAPFLPPVVVRSKYDSDDSLAAWREAAMPSLSQIETFSADDQDLADDVDAILRQIRELQTPAAAILADQWVYLATRSWLASKTRFGLDKIRESGAEVHEYTRRRIAILQDRFAERSKAVGERVAEVRARLVVELIMEVTGKQPPEPLTPRFIAKVGIKWIAYGTSVGGGAAGGFAAGGPGGAFVGGAAGTLARPIVRAFDP